MDTRDIKQDQSTDQKNYFQVKSPLSWDEYFMLQELTKAEGVCVTLLENAKEFLENGSLQLIWQSEDYPARDYYLIAHKKQERFFELLKLQLME